MTYSNNYSWILTASFDKTKRSRIELLLDLGAGNFTLIFCRKPETKCLCWKGIGRNFEANKSMANMRYPRNKEGQESVGSFGSVATEIALRTWVILKWWTTRMTRFSLRLLLRSPALFRFVWTEQSLRFWVLDARFVNMHECRSLLPQ